MFKRVTCLMMALLMLIGLTACKKNTSDDSEYSVIWVEDIVENDGTTSGSKKTGSLIQKKVPKKNTSSTSSSKGIFDGENLPAKPEEWKKRLNFKGETIVLLRDWDPYPSGKNKAHDNFNKWVAKTKKRFNVNLEERKWKTELAGEMLAGVKPEGHLYLVGANSGGKPVTLATKGYIAYLDDAMKKTGITMEEDIYSPYNTQLANINGKQWAIGVGFARICAAIVYNRKVTEAAGYNIPQLINDKKWTWDMMTEIAKKTTEKNPSGEITRYGIAMTNHGIRGMVLSNGGTSCTC